MSLRIKKNDRVKIITGAYKGTISTVLAVDPKSNRAVVERVNMVKRHMKAKGPQQPGAIVDKTAPIHMSNMMLYCENCKTGVRFGTELREESKTKARVCKKCGKDV